MKFKGKYLRMVVLLLACRYKFSRKKKKKQETMAAFRSDFCDLGAMRLAPHRPRPRFQGLAIRSCLTRDVIPGDLEMEFIGGGGRKSRWRPPFVVLFPVVVFVFPTRQEGVVRFYVRVCDASTPRPHPVSRQRSSPVDPAEYPARAARQWIPPSIPPELLASGCRPVSRQRLPSIPPERPVDPAEYPAEYPRVAPEQPVSGSRRASR